VTRLILAAILALGLTACTIPPALAPIVNTGAKTHADEHMAAGEPASRVLCAVDSGGTASGYLFPSFMVNRYGSCAAAWLRAAGIACDTTVCVVLGEDSTTPVLQGGS
jgi:hypothetical protein